MKKSISILFFLFCIIGGLYIGTVFHHTQTTTPISPSNNPRSVESANIIASPISTQSGTTPGLPMSLSIPKLHVNAFIEHVNVDSKGRMDVPKKAIDVAWYEKGYRPGENGNAVIDGHYDKVTGAPAVFYYLKNLQAGDIVTTTDANNQQYIFVISKVAAYPYDGLPLGNIFSASSSSHLILITCNGTWDKSSKNYSKRLVVYADLKK